MSESKRMDRRRFIFVGAGAVAVAAVGGAAWYLTRPSPTTTSSPTFTSTTFTNPYTASPGATSVTVPTTTFTVPTPTTTPSEPKPDKLVFQGHEVHRKADVGVNRPGGVDLIAAFTNYTGVKVEWVTLPNPENYDKLMRECSAAEATINLAHCLTPWFSPRVANLFEPLEPWQEKNPIEDFDDFIPATLQSATVAGKLFGIPIRSSGSTYQYHKGYFEEKGVTPPKTIEEMYEVAKQVTFTKPSGEKVYGFSANANKAELYEMVSWMARSWDGDIVTFGDYKVVCNQAPVVQGLEILAKMYREGLVPANFTQLSNADHVNLVKEGRVAQCASGVSYSVTFNDPKTSKVAGQIELGYHPPAAQFKDKWEGAAPTFTYIWSMIIPRNAKHKAWSWELIKHLSSKASNLWLSMQGTDVARASVYANPVYYQYWKDAGIPKYPDVLQKVLKYGRPPIPAMDEFSQVADIIGTEAELAILGKKTPQQAMDAAKAAIEPLVPKV